MPVVPAERVLDELHQVPARLLMRQASDGRTMVMGTLLTDLCADGFDRLWTVNVIIMPVQKARVKDKNYTRGQRLEETALNHLADQVGDKYEFWEIEQ